MLEFLKICLEDYLRRHGVRAVVSLIISGALYICIHDATEIHLETTMPMIVVACIFAGIALLSLAALALADGMNWLLIIEAVLCVAILVSGIGLYTELDLLEQPTPNTYTGSIYFTGSYCRNCDNGKCRDCDGTGEYMQMYSNRVVSWRCTRCDGDGECNLCNGTGRR